MKAKNLYINDEFQIKGQWFLPNQEDKAIGGILYYSPNGISLELQDVFGEENHIFTNTLNRFSYVLGNCEHNFQVTLVDGIEVNRKTSIIQTSKISFNQMIIGEHFRNDDEIEFHEIDYKYTYLEEWFDDSPFAFKDYDDSARHSYSIDYNQPEANFKVNVNSVDAILEGGSYSNIKYDQKAPKISHENCIRIKPTDGEIKNIYWFNEIEHKVRMLLAFLMNRPIFKTQIIAKVRSVDESVNPPKKIYFYSYYGGGSQYSKIHPSEVFISLNDVIDKLEQIVNLWFDERLTKSISNYIRNLYGEHGETVDNFLRYTKMFESFHRMTVHDAVYMSEKEYKTIRRKMLDSIDGMVNEEFKKKLRDDLIRSYQYEFRKQVEYYLENINDKVRKHILNDKDIDNMVQRITRSRNHYTHYGKKQDNVLEEGFELLYVNFLLKTIAYYWIAKELSLSDQYLEKIIKEDDNLGYKLEKAREVFSKYD